MKGLMLNVPDWLTEVADDPRKCHDIWSGAPRMAQSFATGRTFDAISVEFRLGVETVALLREGDQIESPAVVDHYMRRVAFLVPPGAVTTMRRVLERDLDGPVPFRHVGAGGCVVIAGPAPLPGDRFEWVSRAPLGTRDPESTGWNLGIGLLAARRTVSFCERFGDYLREGSPDDE